MVVLMVVLMVVRVAVFMPMAVRRRDGDLMQACAIGLDVRAPRLPLFDMRALGRDFGTQPIQPGGDAGVALSRR